MKIQKNKSNGFFPTSIKFISSCIKNVSSNVRSTASSVSGSFSSASSDEQRDQVQWACFDRLEFGSSLKRVILLGYANGFQVLDVEDASNVNEVVSRHDDPVTFLQLQPSPDCSHNSEIGYKESHPLLLVVAIDATNGSGQVQGPGEGFTRDGQAENIIDCPTSLRFYSLRTHNYVHVLRFRSTICMVRCNPKVVVVGLATHIYCFDSLTFEKKFSVLTYPVPRFGGQSGMGVNVGYGPMAVGSRWLAYASNNPLLPDSGRLSPQSLTPSPGVSPSTSPANGNLVAHFALESGKQFASGLVNLGDMGYRTLSKYYQDLLPDSYGSSVPSNLESRKAGWGAPHSTETENLGMVTVEDIVSRTVIAQFKAHNSPISALCFDPSGTLLVTASIHGNNINIFRIMPSLSRSGSSYPCYDWNFSHVHLYKLHRGMTSAVIQDIAFSHYSQWVAIVSSKGTCHIFVLSPFGGKSGLQLTNSHIDGPNIIPALSPPWWHYPSFVANRTSSLPSPPGTITISVVCRIKCGSGWLNSASNNEYFPTGKAIIPTGAVCAVFHNSLPFDSQHSHKSTSALEHILVYTPSGHVIQHRLVPSVACCESNENVSQASPDPFLQTRDEELNVRVEPLQWWDVCRRKNWPEKEVKMIQCDDIKDAENMGDVGCMGDMSTKDVGSDDNYLNSGRSHLYISNAEININSYRRPIWQNSKIHFFTILSEGIDGKGFLKERHCGEVEIEKINSHIVGIKRDDLSRSFCHFQKMQSNFVDRFSALGLTNILSRCDGTKEKFSSLSHFNQEWFDLGENHSDGDLFFSERALKIEEPTNSDNVKDFPLKIDCNCSGSTMNITDLASATNVIEFESHIQDRFDKTSTIDGCIKLTEVVTDLESSGTNCEYDKSADVEKDNQSGGVLLLSDEG